MYRLAKIYTVKVMVKLKKMIFKNDLLASFLSWEYFLAILGKIEWIIGCKDCIARDFILSAMLKIPNSNWPIIEPIIISVREFVK